MTLGLAVIFLVSGAHGQPVNIELGCLFILAGAVIDGIDGKLARYLNSTTDLGKQLDSFADLITFGLAPICILWQLEIFGSMAVVSLVLGLFPLAGAFRLARYNIGEYRDYFLGLPITAAGSMLSLYILGFRRFFSGVGSIIPAIVTLVVVVLLAGLMVSTLKVRRIGFRSYSPSGTLFNRQMKWTD